MKVIICGSKDIQNYGNKIKQAIDFANYLIPKEKIDKIVCIDHYVEKWAKNHDYKTKFFETPWLDISPPDAIIIEKDGRKINLRAPQIRDNLVITYSDSIICIYKRQVVNGEWVDDEYMDNIIKKMKELKKKVVVMEIE